MKKLLGAVWTATLLSPMVMALPALANYDEDSAPRGTEADFGSCDKDPIYEHDWSGTVIIGARVRSIACMDGSTVLTTLAVGTKVRIIGETDGWVKIKLADGTKGWVGTQLITKSESSLRYEEMETENETEIEIEKVEKTEKVEDRTSSKLTDAQKAIIRTRVKGRILLEVEKRGEAWFVDEKGERSYMKDGTAAYGIMRSKGLGMSEDDYERLAAGNNELKRRLLGRIILRVHKHGEAYYVHPETGALTYLKDGEAAYKTMRELGLGIKSDDLLAVPETN